MGRLPGERTPLAGGVRSQVAVTLTIAALAPLVFYLPNPVRNREQIPYTVCRFPIFASINLDKSSNFTTMGFRGVLHLSNALNRHGQNGPCQVKQASGFLYLAT